jgi:putative transposase
LGIIDETIIIKVGSEYVWLWIAIENDNREILQISISKERNMFVAERFISKLVKRYREHHPVSTDDDGGTWYPAQACKFLKIKHHLHSVLKKSIIERIIQYIKKIELEISMIIFLVEKINVNCNKYRNG